MSARSANRAAFPATARIVDELREVFGPGVRLEWACENGREIGVRELPGMAVPMSTMVLRVPEVQAPELKAKKGRR